MKEKFKTKRDKVYFYLQRDILEGILEPGTRLLISSIANQYKTSDIPVREALQSLVQEGLIVTSPHSGYIVSQVSEKDVREIFEVRTALEGIAAKSAVNNLSNADIEVLEKMVEDSKKYLEPLDFIGYWKFNREFHLTMYKFSNNERLYRMIEDLYNCSKRYPQFFTKKEELKNSIYEHEIMLVVLRTRNEAQVEKIVKDHTEDTLVHVLTRLKEISKNNN